MPPRNSQHGPSQPVRWKPGIASDAAVHALRRFMPQCRIYARRWFTPQYRKSRPPLIHAAMPHLRTTPVHPVMPHIISTAGLCHNVAFMSDADSRGNAANYEQHRFVLLCRISRTSPVHAVISQITSDAGSHCNAAYHKYRRFPPQCLTSRTPPDCALALERNPDRTWARHMTRLKPVA